ncbi:hypothetical protein CDL15_Pgr003427 [Punica granatum]|uniref:Uncharacterized protein n=1 Tax=Punica granatum TaxID=22663 RepID=A0A218X230_PUNGR|nr:hypothetical protein CDL15_Pgr003427 [Punica granatum]
MLPEAPFAGSILENMGMEIFDCMIPWLKLGNDLVPRMEIFAVLKDEDACRAVVLAIGELSWVSGPLKFKKTS